MSMFLTDAELQEMTGYKRASDQAKWFEKRGYYVECNARGKPRITHAQVDLKRQLSTDKANDLPAAYTEPNVFAFKAKLRESQR